jgi:hypothetical protein
VKSTLLTLAFVAICFVAQGQTARFASDGTLVISDGGKRIRLKEISEQIDHCPTAPCVHAILKRHGEYFVVVTTSDWTRGYPPRGGGGGAGEEAYIHWIHIVDDKVSESTEYRFESWRDNRQGGVVGWRGSMFTVTTSDLLEDKLQAKEKDIRQEITFTFDADHPEHGIKEEKGTPHE